MYLVFREKTLVLLIHDFMLAFSFVRCGETVREYAVRSGEGAGSYSLNLQQKPANALAITVTSFLSGRARARYVLVFREMVTVSPELLSCYQAKG